MAPTEWERFRRSVDWAIRNIEKDAACFDYEGDPEYLAFIEGLKKQWTQTFGADRPK